MNLQIAEYEFYPCKNSETCTSDIKNRFVIVVLIFIYSRMIRKKYASPCSTAKLKINKKFIEDNEIALILYEGECIEKQICKELGISSFNIENLENYGSVDY